MKNSQNIAYVALGAGIAALMMLRARKSVGTGTMQDTPVSLENVRKGIARGWYSAQLCTVDGRPAVKLSGTANGKAYSDYYPVTQSTWNALKADGVQQIGRVCGVGDTMRTDTDAFDEASRAMSRLDKYLWGKYGKNWSYGMLDKEDKAMFDRINADWIEARRNYYRWYGYSSNPR